MKSADPRVQGVGENQHFSYRLWALSHTILGKCLAADTMLWLASEQSICFSEPPQSQLAFRMVQPEALDFQRNDFDTLRSFSAAT